MWESDEVQGNGVEVFYFVTELEREGICSFKRGSTICKAKRGTQDYWGIQVMLVRNPG